MTREEVVTMALCKLNGDHVIDKAPMVRAKHPVPHPFRARRGDDILYVARCARCGMVRQQDNDLTFTGGSQWFLADEVRGWDLESKAPLDENWRQWTIPIPITGPREL